MRGSELRTQSPDDSTLQRLDLRGTYDDMGRLHGEIARREIHELADIRIDLVRRANRLGSTLPIETVARMMARAIEYHTPDVFIETHATAVAANIDYWKLVVAGAFSDVADLVGRGVGNPIQPHNECTLLTFVTGDAGAIILGSWDTHATAIPSLFLCKRKPADGVATVALTTAGWPMQQGFTENGVGFAIANLIAKTAGDGVPYIATLPFATQARTVAAAVERIASLPHASGRFYVFCGNGKASLLEAAPSSLCELWDARTAVHTNHYVRSPSFEGRPEMHNSAVRLELAKAFVETLSRSVSVDDALRNFMRSGVIQSGTGDGDRTGVVFAISPERREMSYVCGQPLFAPGMAAISHVSS
jgi:hypothetical protein